jgi:DNA-binding transcriptional LysR family regulator
MNLSTFDLNLLRVLDALLRENSTVRAGQRIGLSQPAVSAALARLRAALGDPLFVRVGQKLEPTDFALSLAQPLHETLSDIESYLSGPRPFDPAQARDRFRISGSDFFTEMLMPQLGDHVARHAPGILLQMVDLVPDNHIAPLESYEVDLALLPQLECPSWIDWQPLFSSGFVVIARRDNPHLTDLRLAPEEAFPVDLLCTLGHIVFSPEGQIAAMADKALAKAGYKRRVVMTLPVFYGVFSAVASSDHIAFVPEQMADRMVHKLPITIYRPPIPMPRPQIGMVWHKRASNMPAHRWLRAQITQLMAPLDTQPTPPPPSR